VELCFKCSLKPTDVKLGRSWCNNISQRPDLLCLAYIDEVTNEWKCKDTQLQQKSDNSNYYCGKTDHFSSWAVLLRTSDTQSSSTSGMLSLTHDMT
jgi:hypothetical protein